MACKLFEPLCIRGVCLKNRITLSPLCMYSCDSTRPGLATPFHFAHLSTFARGNVGLVFTEATAVLPEGRITPKCLGLWTDEQAEKLKPTVQFVKDMGSVPAIQLAHAGRKASCRPPSVPVRPGAPLTKEDEADGFVAWQTVGPTDLPVAPGWPKPIALDEAGLDNIVQAFSSSAARAISIGFEVIEIHMAHGYLLHTFLSPLSRGGLPFEKRIDFPLRVVDAVRKVIPERVPLFVRMSCIDGSPSSLNVDEWTIDDTVRFSILLKQHGVDVIDCSSGGISGAPSFRVDDSGKPLGNSNRPPGFQVPYAEAVKHQCDMLTMAVGVITQPDQAEEIIREGKADLVALGRELMWDPFWALHAAQTLGVDPNNRMWTPQYSWAITRRGEIQKLNEKK